MSEPSQFHRLTVIERDVNQDVKNYGYTDHETEIWQS